MPKLLATIVIMTGAREQSQVTFQSELSMYKEHLGRWTHWPSVWDSAVHFLFLTNTDGRFPFKVPIIVSKNKV